MPKRKQVDETLESLVEELSNAEEVVEEAVKQKKPTSEDVERKREELVKLALNNEISKTPAQVGRASAKMINKLCDEWEASRLERANGFLCDLIISKFSSVLGGLDAIEKPEEMEKELMEDPLLREDIGRVVAIISPWIPFIGIFSGGITIGKHVIAHTRGPGEPPPTEEEYDTVN